MYVSDGREKVGKLTSTLLGMMPCAGPLTSDSYPYGVNTTPVVDGLAQSTRRAVSLSSMDDAVHQFKGGSCSIGCAKVAGACTRMRDAIKSGNEPEMRAAAQAVCDTYLEAEEVILGILSLLG
jgi:HPt (histidine-containing phosphotransfer) domain-containing protein